MTTAPLGNRLLDLYRESTYRFCDDSGIVALRIGEPSAALQALMQSRGVASAAYLTAWNPGSEPLPFEANRERNDRLRAELRSMGFEYLDGEGGKDEWLEESYLVPGMSLQDAHDLASRHGQAAFVFCERDGVPGLVITEAGMGTVQDAGESQGAIRPCSAADIPAIFEIVNDAARAYQRAIPADCWHEPYMPREELEREIAAGVRFEGYGASGQLLGVMGSQPVRDATLIRHAYVRTARQGQGIGGALLEHLVARASGRLMVGTWAAAGWAIRFYERHGFRLVSPEEKDRLLRRYWTVSARQREVSVVLVMQR
ncbi:MAG TPA: GNAT family N-acetyltransferase [Usitatibacter sp.]|nr:GNAT family N-acetyltransferase [Usitatibacter sp.]